MRVRRRRILVRVARIVLLDGFTRRDVGVRVLRMYWELDRKWKRETTQKLFVEAGFVVVVLRSLKGEESGHVVASALARAVAADCDLVLRTS